MRRVVLRSLSAARRSSLRSLSTTTAAAVSSSSSSRAILSRSIAISSSSSSSSSIHQSLRFASSSSSSHREDGLIPFNLADIGEGITEVEVLVWFIKEGDTISAFDKICEVQSDKATVEITSRYNGVVAQLCWKVGEMAKVGEPLILLDQTGGAATAKMKAAQQQQQSASSSSSSTDGGENRGIREEPTTSSSSPSCPAATSAVSQPEPEIIHVSGEDGKVLAVPAVRRLAREHKIDLAKVVPTGKGGRVTKEDVLAFVANGGSSPSSAKATTTQQPQQQQQQHHAAAAAPLPLPVIESEDSIHPFRGYKRPMIKSMTAQGVVPHFGFGEEIVMDGLVDARNRMKDIVQKYGVRFSYMPLLIKSLSLALREFPQLNAKVNAEGDALIHKVSHNVGIAMDTPTGLVVPNIKNVQNLSVIEIARELNRLTDAAREGKIPPADLAGGTITLSNIGVVAGTYCSPVLLPSELAIAALGRLQVVPRYDEKGNLVPTTIMRVSWSADHRYVDGMTIALFNKRWQQMIQNPDLMILSMK